jgi:hypothetical protein
MDVIAERRLVLTVADGSIEVVAKLGRPMQDESLGSWKCRYEAWFGDSCAAFDIHGGDSLQALQLSMASLDEELKRGAAKRGGQLLFLEEPFGSILDEGGMELKRS